MKNIRLFKTQNEFNGQKKVYPQISYVEENGSINVEKLQIQDPTYEWIDDGYDGYETYHDGEWIIDFNGNAYTESEWSGKPEDAIGILISTDAAANDMKYIIPKHHSNNKYKFYTGINPIDFDSFNVGSLFEPDTSYDSQDYIFPYSNTREIISYFGSEAESALECNKYNVDLQRNGFMPDGFAWSDIMKHSTAIDRIMTTIHGDTIDYNSTYWLAEANNIINGIMKYNCQTNRYESDSDGKSMCKVLPIFRIK